jgi:hypothetical protein
MAIKKSSIDELEGPEDFELEPVEMRAIAQIQIGVANLRKRASSMQLDTPLVRLFDAVELRLQEIQMRGKGTFFDKD